VIYDLDAEIALLGDLIQLPQRVPEIVDRIAPGDFGKPSHGHLFAAIRTLHANGTRLDATTVTDQLRRDGTLEVAGGPQLVADAISNASGGYRRYVDIILGHATRRRVLAACSELAQAASSLQVDAGDLLDQAHALLGGIELPADDLPADFYDFDTYLDRGIEARSPWVVAGLLRRDWRAILVAGEGVGKSVVLRSFALMAAQGVHPFCHADIPRARTLLVDLENPDDAIVDSCTPIREQARRIGKYEPGRAWLWHRPGGINIRSRADRVTFDAILTAAQPDLVCMGPLYKLYRREKNETDEQAAENCQQILDDLRTRHRFALFMEHHAPKGQQGMRDMTPYGSSYWLRWPELGFGLKPDGQKLVLTRWRGDRLPSSWPEHIERDPEKRWPWLGVWPHGHRFDDYLEGVA
jgi:hypothetical protein